MNRPELSNYPESATDGGKIENDSWQNPESVRMSALAINSFLRREIAELKPDLIISELRKGSWIMDNYLQVNGLQIAHKTSSSELSLEDFEGKRVMIFDDSVHTGSSVIKIYDRIRGHCDVSVCCIALNKDAMGLLSEHGIDIDSVHHYRLFDVYCEYESCHLIDSCQSYFYSYVIIPYIGWLTVNQSPDFTVCRVLIQPEKETRPERIAEIVYNAVGIDFSQSDNVNSSRTASRYSAPLEEDVGRYIGLKDTEVEYAKLRISVTELDQSVLVTITPIISFTTSDECDEDRLKYNPGKNYLLEKKTKIRGALGKVGRIYGFDIVRGYEAGLPKEVDP